MSYNRNRGRSCFGSLFSLLLVMAFAGWFFPAVGITDALLDLELTMLGYTEQGQRTQMMDYYLVGMVETQGAFPSDPETGMTVDGSWTARFVTVGGIPVPVLGIGYGSGIR
jgi:hypothetical protein